MCTLLYSCWGGDGGNNRLADRILSFQSVRHYCDVLLLYFAARNTVTGWILVLLPSASLSLHFLMTFIHIHFRAAAEASFIECVLSGEMYCPFTAFVGVSVASEEKTLDKRDNHAFPRIQYAT